MTTFDMFGFSKLIPSPHSFRFTVNNVNHTRCYIISVIETASLNDPQSHEHLLRKFIYLMQKRTLCRKSDGGRERGKTILWNMVVFWRRGLSWLHIEISTPKCRLRPNCCLEVQARDSLLIWASLTIARVGRGGEGNLLRLEYSNIPATRLFALDSKWNIKTCAKPGTSVGGWVGWGKRLFRVAVVLKTWWTRTWRDVFRNCRPDDFRISQRLLYACYKASFTCLDRIIFCDRLSLRPFQARIFSLQPCP